MIAQSTLIVLLLSSGINAKVLTTKTLDNEAPKAEVKQKKFVRYTTLPFKRNILKRNTPRAPIEPLKPQEPSRLKRTTRLQPLDNLENYNRLFADDTFADSLPPLPQSFLGTPLIPSDICAPTTLVGYLGNFSLTTGLLLGRAIIFYCEFHSIPRQGGFNQESQFPVYPRARRGESFFLKNKSIREQEDSEFGKFEEKLWRMPKLRWREIRKIEP